MNQTQRQIQKEMIGMKKMLTNDKHLWLTFGENKHIFVMGVFHYDYNSALEVQNTLNTFKPDCIFLELCPIRALRLRSGLRDYENKWMFFPRDVETAAIMYHVRSNKKCQLICGDVPETAVRARLKKVDPEYEKKLQHIAFTEPASMS